MAEWIIVVDDDISTLKMAGHFLSKAGFRVTALQSGRLALDYVRRNGTPDLFLLDVNMPDLDGFQTFDLLKKEMIPGQEVPVAFLTADENQDQEARGLESGAMDYIKKPFNPEVLVSRARKILDVQSQMNRFARTAETDPLTGFLNKTAAESLMTRLCSQEAGTLCVLDLDAFKSVNDIFGHDVGDRILVMFAKIIEHNLEHPDECGRIGGDEFVVFLRDKKRSEDLTQFANTINEEFITGAKAILGERMTFAIGVSVGGVSVPEYGRDYSDLFHLADQALYNVKRNGKHGGRLYRSTESSGGKSLEMNLEMVTAILEERLEAPNAMWMGREVFGSIYKYMARYMDRYHSCAYRVLLTAKVHPEIGDAKRAEIIVRFRNMIRSSLRTSDVMMECGDNQLFLLLPEIHDYDIERVIGRLLQKWYESEYTEQADIATEFAPLHPSRQDSPRHLDEGEWVVVVDDDPVNRMLAERILKEQRLKVTSLASGQELLNLLREQMPNLVLLDLKMPGMDGTETFRQMKKEFPDSPLPVIFLTADDNPESEAKCLQLGAMDFVRKPIIPEVMILRVHHILELAHLQKNLSDAVARKTREIEALSLHMVQTLAETIDAKDRYTIGHSTRVAEYAREIGRRVGYTLRQQEELYVMGLLHDIGKIGIPDEVINKSGSLTEEEYEIIKTHPRVGARILRKIEEMPRLLEGARWHHERYDGTGYPDGLVGESIPEHARIIAIADAYDAMSSKRRYRDILPQEKVRQEIKDGRGTQFDPRFADVMLAMIDEDTEYRNQSEQ